MRLREAEYSDMDLLYKWANDPTVRHNSISSGIIPYDVHRNWFSRMMDDASIIQLIFMDGNDPVGQIRLNIARNEAELGYSIAPEFRGKGYGHLMLRLIEETVKHEYPDITKLIAKVKPNNKASKRILELEGYEMKYSCYALEVYPEGYCKQSDTEDTKTILFVDIYERGIIK